EQVHLGGAVERRERRHHVRQEEHREEAHEEEDEQPLRQDRTERGDRLEVVQRIREHEEAAEPEREEQEREAAGARACLAGGAAGGEEARGEEVKQPHADASTAAAVSRRKTASSDARPAPSLALVAARARSSDRLPSATRRPWSRTP